jgi:uncharacterized protein
MRLAGLAFRRWSRLTSNVRPQETRVTTAPPARQTMRTVQVKVRPNSRDSSLEEQQDGTYIASIKSPPVDGKANAELLALIARRFGVPKSSVRIKAGAGGRIKLVTMPSA